MQGAAGGREPAEAARLALAAGCDLLLFAFHDEALRRIRLTLAKQLVDGAIDHAAFDAARPRLAAFDARTREPGADELARPLAALTPDGWEARLEAIVQRGLVRRGAVPRTVGPWTVREPEPAYGPSFRAELERLGVPLAAGEAGARHVEIVASRVPLAAEELARLEARCAAGPTVVVALQADGFLDGLDGAALRISAGDPTPLTRRVIARELAAASRA
jgi:hypothetical protein